MAGARRPARRSCGGDRQGRRQAAGPLAGQRARAARSDTSGDLRSRRDRIAGGARRRPRGITDRLWNHTGDPAHGNHEDPEQHANVPGAAADQAGSGPALRLGGQSLRGDDVAVRRRGDAPQPRARTLQGSPCAREADHRVGPDLARQRRDRGVHRLSRPAQHVARPGQGRHPLRHGGLARRGQGAGRVDDVEVRGGEPAVRRREGRRHLRSRHHVRSRDWRR